MNSVFACLHFVWDTCSFGVPDCLHIKRCMDEVVGNNTD